MLYIADDTEDFTKRLESVRDECRPNTPHENDLYWVF